MEHETVFEAIIAAQQGGQSLGITSICSAHRLVLEAALRYGHQTGSPVLIESTCNQVNQFGGYTGMSPADFVACVAKLADKVGLPQPQLILGGDHLGPEVWHAEAAESAMEKAAQLVRETVSAGYLKIHLDASMKLGDDPPGPLSPLMAAERAAILAQAAEAAYAARGWGQAPRYVVGTEVPVPGGARGAGNHLAVTTAADAARTLEISRQAFYARGLESAWERVIALVVQPGVEYGDDFILAYDAVQAADLSALIAGKPLVYEAHSTDYQEPGLLRQMVRDHFTILKVGPALTYAYREAVFALAAMEDELFPQADRSNLAAVLEAVMVARPQYWQKYYGGDAEARRLARKYSYSDRVRYYWPEPAVQAALARLFANLGRKPIPLTLVSQFMPAQYERIRAGKLANEPKALVLDKIQRVLEDYRAATQP
jgi:D-tagatose-1,6-bisphosphate aldolase subunit GatZ/KbaZ